MKNLGLAALLLVTLNSCANWVQLTTEGQNVVQLTAANVSNCARIGSASSQTLNKILFAARNRTRLEQELVTLARNEAGSMNGNAIVSESDIVDGTQQFGVYRC